MSIPARVVRDGLMRAVIALLQMSAQHGGAACADVPECPQLLGRDRMAPSLEELLFVLAKDIGDFEPMPGHSCWGSSFEERMGFNASASKGLGAACIRRVETRKYLAVVWISACPSRTWMVRRSAPASSMCVAKLCRNTCGVTGLSRPARRPAVLHATRILFRSMGRWGRILDGNSQSFGLL